jgi:hypothetical protein
MRTPGTSREEVSSTGEDQVRCQNPSCDVRFTPRTGQHRFCSDKCRWSVNDNTRHVLHRLVPRRELTGTSTQALLALAAHLQSRPESPGLRRDWTWATLRELDLLLSSRGPNDAAVRSYARLRADAVRLIFEKMEQPADLDDLYQYFGALEILRDVGVESADEVRKLRQYGWAAVEFYRDRRDLFKLARALQAFANTSRLDDDEVTARRMTRRAWHVLHEQCSKSEDPNVMTMTHQSTLWDLRLFARDTEQRRTKSKREELARLAHMVNTPGIWIETRRELAGYWTMQGEYDEARRQLQALETLRRQNDGLTTYGAPTLLRPRIEFLLVSGKAAERDEAIHLIDSYAELYRRDPHLYYYRQLQRWGRKHRLPLELPPPAYASPILIYLPRG